MLKRNSVLDVITSELIDLHKKEYPEQAFQVTLLDSAIEYSKAKSQEIQYSDTILEVKELNSSYCNNIKVNPVKLSNTGEIKSLNENFKNRKQKYTFCFNYILGFFKVDTNKGSFIVYTKKEGPGQSTVYRSVICGNLLAYSVFLSNQYIQYKKEQKLKFGYHNVFSTSDGGLIITKQNKIPLGPIFNNQKEDLKFIIDEYFKSGTEILFNKPNNKATLLYGKQGTGKTSILMYLADIFKDKTFIASVNSVQAYIDIVTIAAKQSIPIIVFWEECETNLHKHYNNSVIKDFLNGSKTPINKAGCFTIFTTNHPEDIDKTILNRHKRSGTPMKINTLDSSELQECFHFYFKDLFHLNKFELSHFVEEHLIKMHNNWTGGEVEGFKEWFTDYCSANRVKLPDIKFLEDSFKFYKKELNEVKEFTIELE